MTDEPAEYCRQIEAYLCGKNEGHLIRIVGPAFEQVCGWAAQGVPLKVAFRGIDRYCERYYAKGPRRRPVRIEFCEGDILELFDDWRRAVGVGIGEPGGRGAGEPEGRGVGGPGGRGESLVAHIERAARRLRESSSAGITDELDRLAADAKHARGNRRAEIVARLAELDASLVERAVAALKPETVEELKREADAEMAPFGARMDPVARQRGAKAAFERLVRDAAGLPILSYD